VAESVIPNKHRQHGIILIPVIFKIIFIYNVAVCRNECDADILVVIFGLAFSLLLSHTNKICLYTVNEHVDED
jgi:hypothetical protein